MNKVETRLVIVWLALAIASTHLIGSGNAQSSLGIGTNEAMLPSTGFFFKLAKLDQRAAAGVLSGAHWRVESNAR
ncbi:hypothetical protein [Mesorhizobium sp. NBSH29]|uniref:hypothetical protein n=1 Tax=Mesorhizobium sp. NBSH29 TaxID=2654249 RepID=UPI0027E55D54|nr:hypothetical protein [Mesorhizobium sp. NBSH29]